MNPLEQYVQQATKGLWGKKKLEIREELTAHILERAYKHEIAGIPHETAVAQAIEELGDPKTIRAGMIGVHTMPNVFKISGFLTVIAAGVIAMLSISSAQITGTTRLPIEQCMATNARTITLKTSRGEELPNYSCNGGLFLEMKSLRATLKAQKIRLEEIPNTNITNIIFPNGSSVSLQPERYFFLDTPKKNGETMPYIPGYISILDFVEALVQVNLPFTMSGWDNPVLRIGKYRFQLGTSQNPVRGEDWTQSVLTLQMASLLAKHFDPVLYADSAKQNKALTHPSGHPIWFRKYQHTIQTKLPSKQIVVVLNNALLKDYQVNNNQNMPNYPTLNRSYVTTVNDDGTITYPSDAKTLRFMNSIKELRPTSIDQDGDIVVLKFTHQMSRGKETFAVIPSSKLSK